MENRLSVVPMLDVISKLGNINYIHLTCNTQSELEYNLSLSCKNNYGMLYLAFHGSPGAISLGRKTSIVLPELAEMMGQKFGGWIVHFGSCGTVRNHRQMEDFVEQTGVALATGFAKNVDWAESAALELLLFRQLQSRRSLKVAWNNVCSKYGDLARHTGLQAYPKSDYPTAQP